MTESERAAFAAELATMSGDQLEILLSETSILDGPERYAMIKAEADQVWAEYQAESEARERASVYGCAACGAKGVPYVLTHHTCPMCKVTHMEMCCVSCAAEMEQPESDR